jgi:hypothetical protein
VILLAAELYCIRSMPLVKANLQSSTKRSYTEAILSCTHPTPAIPASVLAGLDSEGAFNGGQGYNAQSHLQWAARRRHMT